jgi:hypothetical protein
MSVNNRNYPQNNNLKHYQTSPRQNQTSPRQNQTSLRQNNENVVVYNVVAELQDYMFTGDNLKQFNKHNFGLISKSLDKKQNIRVPTNSLVDDNKEKKNTNNIYKPLQTDSLFWCFYILKYGLSKYEMEIGNQHFAIEKAEKFKYIEILRKNKDILKINKIKPLSELENDLANNQRISIKTFFALCIMEKINILLVDKRKIYESITADDSKMNVVHRNKVSFEHSIESNVTDDNLTLLRETYYKVQGFDSGLKSMTSYKSDELLELCKKLDIDVSNMKGNKPNGDNKKMTKKDIYEILIQNF